MRTSTWPISNLTQSNRGQARKILVQGKKRYSKLGRDEGCISDIIQRFDKHLERMSPDLLLGSPIFVAYDEPPTPIGTFAAIHRNLEYPQDDIDMGIEGRVTVLGSVDCFGHACLTRVIEGGQLLSMDVAARKAVKSVMWKPGMQRNKACSAVGGVACYLSVRGLMHSHIQRHNIGWCWRLPLCALATFSGAAFYCFSGKLSL